MRCCLLISIALIPISSVSAAPPVVWKATRTLAAPEANQAAAADGRFVYAITNDRVAQYDCESGKLIATSTGEARHLNSGFVSGGRLYCAHSNYPKTPEQSEIKVLDPASMQLRTFHDFGNFGGSLTWVLWHERHWWCNFARYGRDNGQTFLVKFDEEWHERGRWTYPAEVIGKLGNYSLSGGIWRDGDLLVTGHDDPVVFRLRLPRTGNVLEFVETQSVPFTGQGIANDPETGGLVGINRAKREVVFAELPDAPLRLRVLTYNIHHGAGIDGKLDLERIARVIRDARPDIVALQELDRNTQRTRKVDQPAELARLTGLHGTFGGNIALQGANTAMRCCRAGPCGGSRTIGFRDSIRENSAACWNWKSSCREADRRCSCWRRTWIIGLRIGSASNRPRPSTAWPLPIPKCLRCWPAI